MVNKTLIITPNSNQICGMFQRAKELAKDLNADIRTRDNFLPLSDYDEIITFLYPMHKLGRKAKLLAKKWICYDQAVPPVNKQNFPNFFRRQYMRWFTYVNKRSMRGADEYWDINKIKQKPFFEGKKYPCFMKVGEDELTKPYALYVGRITDYKHFDWLQKTMKELNIELKHPKDIDETILYSYYENAKLFVSASTWEGYGRVVMEAQALNIPTVCFDTGAHRENMHNGIIVANADFKTFKESIIKLWCYK